VNITPVSPAGQGVDFALLGDATYAPASGSSTGGWQIVDRPRLVAATQWYDRSPMQLDLPLMIDSHTLYGNDTSNIETLCILVDSWQDKVPGTQQPPVLSVSGPVPGIQHQWVIYTVSFGEALRDPNAGFRVQQKVQFSLYEYNSPLATIVGNPTPAQAAQQALNAAEASQSYSLYVVAAGDNLVTIAANTLGFYTLWTSIAALNDIRDPNNVTAGQIIKIPQP
jgi:hypothetical protein